MERTWSYTSPSSSSPAATRAGEINLAGSRNVFKAAAEAGAARLVYTSSVAAYGFDSNLPETLTEDLPVRGSDRHPYSAHKAAVEQELWDALKGSATDAYVFRPCIVAGPQATLLLDMIPFLAVGRRIPGPLRWALRRTPALRPVLPDPGVPFQLVHQDDVAAALPPRYSATASRGSSTSPARAS